MKFGLELLEFKILSNDNLHSYTICISVPAIFAIAAYFYGPKFIKWYESPKNEVNTAKNEEIRAELRAEPGPPEELPKLKLNHPPVSNMGTNTGLHKNTAILQYRGIETP